MCRADFAEGLERKEGEEVVNHHNNGKTRELQLILRQVFPKFLVDSATAAAVRQLTSRILANFFLSFFLID